MPLSNSLTNTFNNPRLRSKFCHLQKHCDDTATVAYSGNTGTSWSPWCSELVQSCLHLNTTKINKMMEDFKGSKPLHLPVSVQGQDF